jgi:hypothetical protein
MADQPKALQLAAMAHLGYRVGWQREAAAELRRLHAVNQELLEALRLTSIDCQYLHHAHKDRHLLFEECPVVARINAAIAKAEGQA